MMELTLFLRCHKGVADSIGWVAQRDRVNRGYKGIRVRWRRLNTIDGKSTRKMRPQSSSARIKQSPRATT